VDVDVALGKMEKTALGKRGRGGNAHAEMGESAMTRAFLQLFFVENSQLCEKKDKNKNRKINAHTHSSKKAKDEEVGMETRIFTADDSRRRFEAFNCSSGKRIRGVRGQRAGQVSSAKWEQREQRRVPNIKRQESHPFKVFVCPQMCECKGQAACRWPPICCPCSHSGHSVNGNYL